MKLCLKYSRFFFFPDTVYIVAVVVSPDDLTSKFNSHHQLSKVLQLRFSITVNVQPASLAVISLITICQLYCNSCDIIISTQLSHIKLCRQLYLPVNNSNDRFIQKPNVICHAIDSAVQSCVMCTQSWRMTSAYSHTLQLIYGVPKTMKPLPHGSSLTTKRMTLSGHFALKSGSGSASHGLAFWLSENTVRKFTELRIYCQWQQQESSAKLTNQRVSDAFTSSAFSIHVRHILPTSKFQHSYFTFFLYQWTACVKTIVWMQFTSLTLPLWGTPVNNPITLISPV